MIENKKKIKIFYWSPFISKVATVKAVLNSAISIQKFGQERYQTSVINSVGEWNEYENKFIENKIGLVNFFKKNQIQNFKTKGFFYSRFLYIFIILKSFLPLLNLLKQNKGSYVIIHLLTSLPLFLNLIFKLDNKFILRISGYPKLNPIRKFFWKIALRKIYFVTCPTEETMKNLISDKIIDKNKIFLLRDPVLNIREIHSKLNLKKDEEFLNFENKKYYLAIGRLTKQKNFSFLIDCFFEIIKKDLKKVLIIIGEGEEYKMLKDKILSLNLTNNIFLLGYKKNVFDYIKKAEAFLLSSLWEDPGFVIIEAAYFGKKILSSDCRSGPKEVLQHGDAGLLFKNNSKEDFLAQFEKLNNLNYTKLNKMKIKAKKISKNYTLFNHFKSIIKLIN